ncbi:MAG: phosphatidylglycerol---prolipoprotein diacylglyceryl transferase [Thermosediminibacterales bacterium]|nr:phosphatidylglycerol---prolipoprotein diacylglyceryl transferase [Thermosediminibacterales bacterium]
MNPIAFEIGNVKVYWYGIILASATLTGLTLAVMEAKRRNFNVDNIIDLVVFAVPVSIVFARLYYVIFNWELYRGNFYEMIAVWHGGIAIHGSILGGLLTTYVFTKIRKMNFWETLDIFAPSLIIGQAIGRWGNFVNQEAYGYETNLPWAMYIDGAYRHPTFLYESLWDFGVFLFLTWFKKKQGLKNGDVFWAYAAMYSVGRFFIEGFRTDSLMLGQFRIAQVVSVIAIILAVIFIFRNHNEIFKKQSGSV